MSMIQSMPTIRLELLGETNLYFGMGIEIITALILGGIIGFDREKKLKTAGIKTNVLICLGACLYTAVSQLNLYDHTGVADPNRLAAQIVSGIGFLGAGAIIHGRGGVRGLTTAATIWVVAAIGVTIGFGFPLIASIFTLTMLLVLNLLTPIYRFIESRSKNKLYHFEILSSGSIYERLKDLFYIELAHIHDMYEESLNDDSTKRITYVTLFSHPHKIDYLSKEIKKLIRIEQVTYYSVDKPINPSDD